MGKFRDLTGQRFGRLTVIERAENQRRRNGQSIIVWRCYCDCGNYVDVRAGSLTSHNTTSCGCYDRERRRKYCTYDLESEEYGIGYTRKNDKFIFDKEDYSLIEGYCWNKSTSGYFETNKRINGKKTRIGLHRLVMNVTDNTLYVDHIGHNKWDNRKSQLRIVTNSQNQMNRDRPINNSSGEKGIYWKHNKWEAGIRYQDKYIYLGRFDEKNDALKARREAEEKYFGEWSYENSQKLIKES